MLDTSPSTPSLTLDIPSHSTHPRLHCGCPQAAILCSSTVTPTRLRTP